MPTKPWAEVEQSEAYKAMPAGEQEAARSQYFDSIIKPQLPPDDVEGARAQFDAQTKPKKTNMEAASGYKGPVEDRYDPNTPMVPYILSRINRGIAKTFGMPVDTTQSAIDLVGSGASAAGLATGAIRPDQAYDRKRRPVGGSEHLEELIPLANYRPKPSSAGMKFVGDALEDAVSMFAIPGRGMVAKAGQEVQAVSDAGRTIAKDTAGRVGATGAVAAGSGVGSATLQAIDPDNPAMGPLGAIIGGTVLPAWAMARGKAASIILDPSERAALKKKADDALKPYVEAAAEKQLEKNVREAPHAPENIREATAIEQKIPGLSFTAGEKTGAAGVVANEKAAFLSSAAALEARKEIERVQTGAILDFIVPAEAKTTTKRSLDNLIQERDRVTDVLKEEERQLRETTQRQIERLQPKGTPEERADVLKFQRAREKGVADETTAKLYRDAEVAASTAHAGGPAKFNPGNITATAEKIMSDPLVGFDPKNAPAVVRQLEGLQKERVSPVLGPDGKPIARDTEMSFAEVKALDTAINQDIQAVKAQQGNPNARQQLRALYELKGAIGHTVTSSPYPDVAAKYAAASEYYKTKYAPRFLSGTNLKMTLTDSLGNDRIVNEKLLDNYTSNSGNARRFVDLFGNNAEATVVMRDHMLDKFQRDVFRNGEFSPDTYANFMRKHEDVLTQLDKADPGLSKKFGNVKAVMEDLSNKQAANTMRQTELANDKLGQLLGTRDTQVIVDTAMTSPKHMGRLTDAVGEEGSKAILQSVVGKQFKEMAGDNLDKSVASAGQMAEWLNGNWQQLSIIARKAYGAEAGREYMENLRTATRALQIQERVKVPTEAITETSIGKDPLKQGTGVTTRTLFSLYRSVVTGRGSVEDAVLAGGGQAASHILTKRFNEMQQAILSDPEQTKNLLKAIELGDKSQLTKGTAAPFIKMLGTMGYYLAGGQFYGPNTQTLMPLVATQLAGEGVKAGTKDEPKKEKK